MLAYWRNVCEPWWVERKNWSKRTPLSSVPNHTRSRDQFGKIPENCSTIQARLSHDKWAFFVNQALAAAAAVFHPPARCRLLKLASTLAMVFML